jgi:hypothetical protein
MDLKKRKLIFLLVVILLLGFFVFQGARKKSLEIKEKDWLEYSNNDWGFTIEYPPGMDLEITADDLENNIFGLSLGEYRMGIYDSGMEDHVKLYLLEETVKEIEVSGFPAVSFHKDDMKGEKDYVPHVLVKRGPVIYVFVGEGDEFNEILSTFKFQ